MKNKPNDNITLNGIKGVIPLIAIFVTVLLTWSNLSNQNSRNTEDIVEVKDEVKDIKGEQKRMNDALIRIATVIEQAERNGQLGVLLKESRVATTAIPLTPTPFSTPKESATVQVAQTQEPAPNPTPQPTPTPLLDILPDTGVIIIDEIF